MYTLYTCTDCTVVTVQKKTTFVYSSVLSIPTLTINDTVHLYSVYTSWLHSMGTRDVVSILMALVLRRLTQLSLFLIYLYFFCFFKHFKNILKFQYDFNSSMKMRISVSWCILLSIGTADVLGHWFDVFIITHLKVRVKLKS